MTFEGLNVRDVMQIPSEELDAKLRQVAAAHRRSVTQETIHLLETAIIAEEKALLPAPSGPVVSK